jgi:eukaryotic-like serine/threonine-protein kinase
MALSVGTKLGPYEIVAPLGAGGMGEVYRAKDTRLGRDVAIKILPKELSADVARKQRFEREAKTISGLNHPNICTLHDVGSQDGVDYLVLECVEGETLAARLQKGPMPLEQVIRYGAQIADALDKAHRAGIVHRDLKPGNVMLTASGAKLLDFGLAKPAPMAISGLTLTGAVLTGPVTQEGTIVGTFQYMSPEQVEGKEVDGRSDIFSLGAVLYEMLTGQRAFGGQSHLSVASAILEKEPAPISSIKPLTPSTLERTIKKCLEKLPDDRWQSASDLASQLKWIAEGGASSGTAGAVVGQGAKARLMNAVLAPLAVAAMIAAGLAWWRSAKPSGKNVVRLGITMPAGDPILTSGPAVAMSPDGGRLVFEVSHGGASQLATRELSSFDLKVIPGTEGAGSPFFSPDGEWLAFVADAKLRKVAMSGGPAVDLADAENFQGGTWLADGSIVYSPFYGGLKRVPASGGKPEILTEPDASRKEMWHLWPQALPSGNILFAVASGEGDEESNIAVLSMKSKKWTTVIEKAGYPQYSPSGHIVYLHGGTVLAVPFDENKLTVTGTPVPVLKGVQAINGTGMAQFCVGREGTLVYIPGTVLGRQNTLVSVDRTGKETALRAPPRAYEDLSLSPDGKQLAMTIVGDRQWSVWIYDLQQGSLNRVTFEGDNRDPIWSADGKRIIYESTRNGHKGIFWKPVSGPGGEEELVTTALQPLAGSVSKDGRDATFSANDLSGLSGIYQLPLQGERKPKLLFSERLAMMESISPDGKWLAYESADSGRTEVYVRGYASGSGKWQVSTEGGTRAWWSADGRELFFRSTDSKAGFPLMSVAVTPGNEFVASAPHSLFRFSCNQTGHDYAPTPDGQHFLCIKPPESEATATQVNVVLNWATELEKK